MVSERISIPSTFTGRSSDLASQPVLLENTLTGPGQTMPPRSVPGASVHRLIFHSENLK